MCDAHWRNPPTAALERPHVFLRSSLPLNIYARLYTIHSKNPLFMPAVNWSWPFHHHCTSAHNFVYGIEFIFWYSHSYYNLSVENESNIYDSHFGEVVMTFANEGSSWHNHASSYVAKGALSNQQWRKLLRIFAYAHSTVSKKPAQFLLLLNKPKKRTRIIINQILSLVAKETISSCLMNLNLCIDLPSTK